MDSSPGHRWRAGATAPLLALRRPLARDRPGQPLLLLVESQHRRARHVGPREVLHEDVVHDLAVARTHFHRLNVLRLGEIRRDVEVLVVDRAGRGDFEVLLHLEHEVRLADRPARGETGAWAADPSCCLSARLRRPRRAASSFPHRSACVRFRTYRRARPRAMAACALRRPRRDGFGIRAGVFIRQKGHRRDLAGTMAGRAVLVEDGRDVLGEGRGRRFWVLRSRCRQRGGERAGKNPRRGKPRQTIDWMRMAGIVA